MPLPPDAIAAEIVENFETRDTIGALFMGRDFGG